MPLPFRYLLQAGMEQHLYEIHLYGEGFSKRIDGLALSPSGNFVGFGRNRFVGCGEKEKGSKMDSTTILRKDIAAILPE